MPMLPLGPVEARFADLIWVEEPITSPDLVILADAELNWKKSTTYTVLRRLCDRGLFQNVKGTVTSLLSREEYLAQLCEQFVEDHCDGSPSAFLQAYLTRQSLSPAEHQELERLLRESPDAEHGSDAPETEDAAVPQTSESSPVSEDAGISAKKPGPETAADLHTSGNMPPLQMGYGTQHFAQENTG